MLRLMEKFFLINQEKMMLELTKILQKLQLVKEIITPLIVTSLVIFQR